MQSKKLYFHFNKFPNSDLLLGPEMKSTGEVMGFDKNFGMAFAKAKLRLQIHSKKRFGIHFIKDAHKDEGIDLARN